jgi:hypothetical protein
MNNLIFQYSYLQVLDLLTTVAFLMNGVKEANPVVKGMMHITASPLTGLLMIKVVAIALGVYCWRIHKYRLLVRINILFALLVAWNMVALIAGSSVLAA